MPTATRCSHGKPAVIPPRDPDDDEFVEPGPCPACGGAGWVEGDDDEDNATCPLCDGTGEN